MTLPLTGAGPSASAGIANWWDPNNVGLSCVGAYRAKGAASYAASLVNNVTPGTYDLVEGNGAVPWAAATGWGFVAASLQYFDTGLVPANDQSWSILIQFDNYVLLGGSTMLAGLNDGGGKRFWVGSSNLAANEALYSNGGSTAVAIALLSGNRGVIGNRGYRNGVAEGAALGAWGGATLLSIYIGAVRGPALYCTSDIHAVVVYNGGAAAVAAEALAIAAAMAAL